jgi:hypothetical protein
VQNGKSNQLPVNVVEVGVGEDLGVACLVPAHDDRVGQALPHDRDEVALDPVLDALEHRAEHDLDVVVRPACQPGQALVVVHLDGDDGVGRGLEAGRQQGGHGTGVRHVLDRQDRRLRQLAVEAAAAGTLAGTQGRAESHRHPVDQGHEYLRCTGWLARTVYIH